MPGTTTGLAPLADVGLFSYNGVRFSCLYRSKLDGKIVADDAGRVTKNVDWSLAVEGVVTLEADQNTTDPTWAGLRQRLTTRGGVLRYEGKGFSNLNVNGPYPPDVAYGPEPELLGFQPLGGSRAANITWRCTTRVPQLPPSESQNPLRSGVLQFSYSYGLDYDDRGYAGATFRGVLEIPLAASPVGSRLLQSTVDGFRQQWLDVAFDLTKYQVVGRSFDVTPDKRKCAWAYQIKQQAPAGLPVGSTRAKGRMVVKNLAKKQGGILASPMWGATLTCTYVVRPDFPRRVALFSFLSLLWFRMWSALAGGFTPNANDAKGAQAADFAQQAAKALRDKLTKFPIPRIRPGSNGAIAFYGELRKRMNQAADTAAALLDQKNPALPLLTDFGFDEGLYEEADSITFHASWRFFTSFSALLAASGVWRYNLDVGGNTWQTSVADIMGWRSALRMSINPKAEVIVDMAGGSPLTVSPLAKE